jgi:peptide-methionine (S)-S-oxide reductase
MDATEAFMVEFDPSIVSYEEILDEWAHQHEPFYPSKCQYRSAIFYCNNKQLNAAQKKIEELRKGGLRKVYVDLEPVSVFYMAEEYHQDFLEKQMSSRAPRF